MAQAQFDTPATTATSPKPAAAVAATDLEAIIAQQLMLLTAQATVVRELEDSLTISPPGQPPPIAPPPTGTDLQAVIDTQTAAIRTQAAYVNHLNDLLAVNPAWSRPTN